MANDEAAAVTSDPAERSSAKDWFVSISGQLKHTSAGDRARLRKMELGRAHSADGVIIRLLTNAEVDQAIYERDYRRWQLLLHSAAMLAGTGALASHEKNRRLGSALHEANVSENRLLRLLAARDEMLRDQVRLMARILGRQRKPVNLSTLYHLIGDDAETAAAARIRIAQDYYAAQARSQKGTTNDD